jgi:hypothetical protein
MLDMPIYEHWCKTTFCICYGQISRIFYQIVFNDRISNQGKFESQIKGNFVIFQSKRTGKMMVVIDV